ncbi:leucyl/phenylalanyl-tRNA--protein transferase [Leeia sp. TBRC 13508]|uniref:Leucyl/phenylalanyl-tRNA--protein transferase n=1 Tax=Leeia speluncae TaxID=2884804 RepID=A0ABS8D8G3_9NEIS|nr:leucyl/phenylalanyl-tRNA--protein transferase [Leeia speluncae]MCB6184508.1 leucyl/phenylalanyl-tRNA--protein transferase [Leeia speluncae]
MFIVYMIPWLDRSLRFPDPSTALTEPNGLLAAGGDLSARRLLAAYHHGIFPWYNPGEPILWWSPDPRMIIYPDQIRVHRSLSKVLRNKPFQLKCNQAFDQVMDACAAPRGGQAGTWIVDDIKQAYHRLFVTGHAHSIECWLDNRLVGGLYGVAIGKMFFGESMFSKVPDASKIALTGLCRILDFHQFDMIDCQMYTDHLAFMGGETMRRGEFLLRLDKAVKKPAIVDLWGGFASESGISTSILSDKLIAI